MQPQFSILAAVARHGVIGHKNRMPWKIPQDLKFFRRITMGHMVIMGRKTYESIGHPLDGRINIILTNNKNYVLNNNPEIDTGYLKAVCCHSLSHTLTVACEHQPKTGFIIGGREIYTLFLPMVSDMIITHIDKEINGDTFFPNTKAQEWFIKRSETFIVGGISCERRWYKRYLFQSNLNVSE